MSNFDKALELLIKKSSKFRFVHDSIVIEDAEVFSEEELDEILKLLGYEKKE